MNGFSRCVGLVALMAFLPTVMCEEIFSIHGSGTTNPSKCFWNIMSKIQEQSHAFTRLTYRAVGSGTGQTEFIGQSTVDGIPAPVSDFGSGDIPLSESDYNSLKKDDGSSTVVHLPFVVSGVSFFHSVPNVPQGKGGLNLTSCLLAQIFNGEINTWEDKRIVEENPNLLNMLGSMNGDTLPITVAHRWEGSSSTKSITQYLNLKCPNYWPADMVNKSGSKITWADDSKKCDSSGEMTACIRAKEGTIGYIDAGHGWDEGLTEIELKNKDGYFVSSLDSFNSGGTGVAATKATLNIESFDTSFHDVSLLDQEGENTWPILVMSYIYIRTNIDEYVTETGRQGLLSIFLKAMYEPTYIDTCKGYGFTPVPSDVRTKALNTIKAKVSFPDPDEWSFEVGIEKIEGQMAKKISPKRRAYGEYERSKLVGDLKALADNPVDYQSLVTMIDELKSANAEKSSVIQKLTSDMNAMAMEKDDDASSDTIALTFSIISFVLWCLSIMYVLVMTVCLKKEVFGGQTNRQDIV